MPSWAVGVAASLEAMVTEPRPSRDSFLGRSPPKRWEEDRKVLIHWGMLTMRSRTGGSAGIPDASDKQARVFGKTCSVRGEPLLAYLSGDRAPKGLAAKVGCKTTTKGRKTLATTHVDKVQWHGWTQQAIRQKPNKSAHFTNSRSEPDKRRELTVSTYLKEKNFPEEECISQAEAARIRGVSRQAIARLIKKGRFRILRIGDKVFLDRREVQAYKPETSGRPPK